MNFFEQQDRTRRRTKRLVVLFILAVVMICLAIYVIVRGAVFYFGDERVFVNHQWAPFVFWKPRLFFWSSISTIALIALGSWHKISQLAAGGSAVASLLGGSLVPPNSAEEKERRLLNVVEEMAIASGVPVPSVYVLPNEESINAFAAGFTPSDAAVTVTRGTLETLNRDELQGVIAHEFSHIFNGDMRLNIRLAGLLNGILLIGMIGQFLMRARGRKSGGIVLFGLVVAAVGYIGVFFGRLIQAAVSRQREFLADASAVQFTRNPDGIIGALKKIAGLPMGSILHHHEASGVNHMMFGSALGFGRYSLLASHPPLEERLKALDPRFRSVEIKDLGHQTLDTVMDRLEGVSGLVASVGTVSPEHVSDARNLIAKLPEELRMQARTTESAKNVVYSLLLDSDPELREKQIGFLNEQGALRSIEELDQISKDLGKLGTAVRLPMIDLVLPALRQMTPAQYKDFSQNLIQLIRADQKVSWFEFVLMRVLIRHLRRRFERRSNRMIRYRTFESIQEDVRLLLSALARMGREDESSAASAFKAGIVKLTRAPLEISPSEASGIAALQKTFSRLALAAPLLKQEILEASVLTVSNGSRPSVEAVELLRAVADTMGCPVPLTAR